MEDFTGSAVVDQPVRRSSNIPPEFQERIRQLVADWGAEKSPELIEELIVTALKMARDKMGTGDLKLMNRSLKELRYAAKIFAPYRDKRKVVVFGSARTVPSEPEAQQAEEFGRQMVANNYMVITGGGDGIMGAAQEGAGAEKSFGLNIRLPFEQRANEWIHGDPKLINFRYFFTRKLNFVKETHAFALFPGGFGTHDEGCEVLTLIQTGKSPIVPIVLLDRPNGHYWETWRRFVTNDLLDQNLISASDLNFFKVTHDIDEAMAEILQFYRNFHSYRWVQDRMVIRVNKRLTAAAIARLNTNFEALLASDKIIQTGALPEEAEDAHLAHFYRIVLIPHRRDFGTMRLLIDAINKAETETERAPLADVATTQHM